MTDHTVDVLILGGGFAGAYTAMYLEKKMSRGERRRIKVALVNQDNYFVFQPLLPEVISGSIEILHAINPIRRLAPRTQLYTREVEDIDLKNKTVRLAPGFRPKPLTLHYDHLVIALGTVIDFSKVPGSREHAIPFKYLGDALLLRNHTVRVLEEADNETDADQKRKLLTFVVAGGGFSGVECTAELNDFVRSAARVYQNIKPGDFRVVLLQSAERILPEMVEGLAQFAHRLLGQRGVEIRLNTRLKAVTADEAVIEDKLTKRVEIIPTKTTVTTVPASPHPLVARLPCKLDGGRITVNGFLEVPDWPCVWALGDCALNPQKSPPTAQHALRQAKVCAQNILAVMRTTPKKPFSFAGLGKLGSLGHRSAVADLFGVKISGILAWFLWRTVYFSKFPGWDRKVRIGLDWFLDLIFPKDITQIRIFPAEAVAQEHFEAGDVIFDQGDFGDKVYFIARGEVEIIKDGSCVAVSRDGDVFGEIALISDTPRTAAVRAKTAVDVIVVSRTAFKKILAHVPGVQQTMEEVMGQHLGRRVDLTEEIK